MSTINEALHELNKKVSIKEANGEELDGMEECDAKSNKPIITEDTNEDTLKNMVDAFEKAVREAAAAGYDLSEFAMKNFTNPDEDDFGIEKLQSIMDPDYFDVLNFLDETFGYENDPYRAGLDYYD